MDFTMKLNDHTLEYLDDEHIYLCDGVIIPSITQVLNVKFGNKYSGVKQAVLQRASEKGTEVHNAIEEYCKHGTESDLKEVRNFKFLQRQYQFSVLENEVPVLLTKDDMPLCAGRLDLVLKMGDKVGLGDIKRTSTLDKNYLAYQLNLYRIAYKQCYGVECRYLKGLHLREDTRKFVDIPINEEIAWEIIEKYYSIVKHYRGD